MEDYEQGALQKELIIALFLEQFKTDTLRKFYWQISLVLTPTGLSISFLLTFSWQKAMESVLYERSRSLLLS